MPRITINEVDNSLYNNATSTQPTVACNGPATTGPFNTPTLCTSINDFTTQFGFNNTEGSQTYSYVTGVLSSGISVLFTRVQPDNVIQNGVSVNPIQKASVTVTGLDTASPTPVADVAVSGVTGSGYSAAGTLPNPNVVVGNSDQDVVITATANRVPMTANYSGTTNTIVYNGVPTDLSATSRYLATYGSMTFSYTDSGETYSVSLVAAKIMVLGSDIRVSNIITIEDTGLTSSVPNSRRESYSNISNINISSVPEYTYTCSELKSIKVSGSVTDLTPEDDRGSTYEVANVQMTSSPVLTLQDGSTIPWDSVRSILYPISVTSGSTYEIPGVTWTAGSSVESTDYFTSNQGFAINLEPYDTNNESSVINKYDINLPSGMADGITTGSKLVSSSPFKITYIKDGVSTTVTTTSITFTNIQVNLTTSSAQSKLDSLSTLPSPVSVTYNTGVEETTELMPFTVNNCIWYKGSSNEILSVAFTTNTTASSAIINATTSITASNLNVTNTYTSHVIFTVPLDNISALYVGSRGTPQWNAVGTFDSSTGDFTVDGSTLNMSLSSGYLWTASYSYYPVVPEFTISERYGGTFGNQITVSITRVVGNTEGASPVYEQATTLTPREVYDIRVLHSKYSTALETVRVTNISSDANYIFNDNYKYITINPLKGMNTQITPTGGITLSGGTDADNDLILDKLPSTYSMLSDKYTYTFSFVTAGGSYVSSDSSHGTDYFYELFNAMVSLCETRGDAVAILDTPYPTSIVGAKSAVSAINSSYAVAYLPWVYTSGSQGDGSSRWMPPSYPVLTAIGRMISTNTPLWYPIAGSQRGYCNDVLETEYAIDGLTLDSWQEVAPYMNPIMEVGNQGYLIYGQKTLYSVDTLTSSALESLNVRVTANLIKARIFQICSTLAFSPNTNRLWNDFRAQLDEYLLQMKSNQGLVDYQIIMDTSNNTDQSIEQLQLNGLVKVDIVRAAEYINIDFVITGTGELTAISDNVEEVL